MLQMSLSLLLLWVPLHPHQPHQDMPTPPGLRICFPDSGSLADSDVLACVYVLPLAVCVCMCVADLPPSLAALKQSSFEMTSEQKPLCALPQRHSSDSFIQEKSLAPITPPTPSYSCIPY